MPKDEVIYMLGKLDANVSDIRDRVSRIEAGQDSIRESVEVQGMRLSSLPCSSHESRIEDLSDAVCKDRQSIERVTVQLAERTAVRRWWGGVAHGAWRLKAYWIPATIAALAAVALAAFR